jgi:very-short-patch-repair endonuclease
MLARLAGRQKQLIRTDQLAALGFGSSIIGDRIRSQRLFRIHCTVYAIHPPPYSPHQRWLAATFACGPGSLLAGWAAAGLHRLAEFDRPYIEVFSPTGRGRSTLGIRVLRCEIDGRDRRARHGIPVTSPTRTIVGLARTTSQDGLEDLLLAADSLRILDRRRLDELLTERAGRPGTRALRELITDDPIEARSVNERRLFAICRRFGVRLPEVNRRIETAGRTFYADFCWSQHRLIVEADSWRWHGGRSAGESDADRDQLLSMAGWRVVHFTRDQIKRRRDDTGRRLAALTSRRA